LAAGDEISITTKLFLVSFNELGWTVGYLLATNIVSPTGPLAQLICYKIGQFYLLTTLICLKFGKIGGLIRDIWDKKGTNS
jgi:hypothetical protein